MPDLNGVLVVDKDAGMTSHDVVGVVRKLFRTKRVGHTGTLDPDATGVLVLCLGNATRLAEYLSASRKHYVAEVVFGIETDTQDASGTILAEQDGSGLDADSVRGLLGAFRGTILQIPPMVSARHHEGKRLYDLARQGITVEREARPVQIDLLEMTAFAPGRHPVATLEITCSTGTYIRSLAADIGTAAATGGMMRSLRRTWVGESVGSTGNQQTDLDEQISRPFSLPNAHTLDELRRRAHEETLLEVVLPLSVALINWPQVRLTPDQVVWIRYGRPLPLSEIQITQCRKFDLNGWQESEREAVQTATPFQDEATSEGSDQKTSQPIALFDSEDGVVAIASIRAGNLQPGKVFAQ